MLIEKKPCRLQLEINKTQKLGDQINTALTDEQCCKRKTDVKWDPQQAFL